MRVKLQLTATLISVVAILAGIACKKLTPEYWTDVHLASIALFWLMEMVMSFILDRFEPHIDQPTLQGKRFMTVYMIAKGIKLLVTIIFIASGIALLGGTESKTARAFAITAVVLYLLHLAGETFAVTRKK